MSLDKRFRRVVFGQVMLGLVAFCIAVQSPALLLIVGALAAASWYVTEGPQAWYLPQWAINVVALGATAWVAYEALALQVAMPLVIGHLMIALQLVVLFSRKENLEYVQLLVLSLMQMIAAGARGTSPRASSDSSGPTHGGPWRRSQPT